MEIPRKKRTKLMAMGTIDLSFLYEVKNGLIKRVDISRILSLINLIIPNNYAKTNFKK